ncbi:hypothetical protein AB2L27_17755 [Kineococcus sp. LSe6-4]|uniref:Uncharacterized protein n=1 Tax=Kineococcus halophytocola TaxID=3234027 RepID=A0ABV4H4V0_9ACTN
MSTAPLDPAGADHRDLLAVLRGAPAAAAPVPLPPPPASVSLLPEAATSRHQLVADLALAGGPVLVDVGPGAHDGAPHGAPDGAPEEGQVLLVGLLAALAAAGRSVRLVPGPATAGARAELTRLGLGHLLADVAEDASRRGAGLPASDPNRWLTLLRDLDARHRAWFTPGGAGAGAGASRSEQVAGLAALRAEHLHPPLLPVAATWSAQDRARVAALLDRARAVGEEPLRGVPEERLAAAADDLDRLPDGLDRLAALVPRLASETGWRPRTVSELAAGLPVLTRVEDALRTYVPAALRTDLDQTAAVLARQPRSLLSAEERERRRELKRLAALRHDGASFGPGDVEALGALQRDWAATVGGAPAPAASRADLADLLDPVRRSLVAVADVVPDVPADPELDRLGDVAGQVRRAARAVRGRQDRAAVEVEGLADLAAAVPAGSGPADVARLVDGTHWRAALEAADPGGAPVARVAEDFRRLDEQRRARAVRELQLALSGARARPVQVAGREPGEQTGEQAGEQTGDVDVLVVEDAHRLAAPAVAELADRAGQLVLLGTGGGEDGSAWTRAAAVLPVLALPLPVRPSAVAEAVTSALTAAGVEVVPAGTPGAAELELREGGARLLLGLEDALATWRVQDREVVRPARARATGVPYRLLRVADWSTDPRAVARSLAEEVRALAPAVEQAPAAAAPAVPVPVESFPKGLGAAEDAQRAVSDFVTALAGGNPNIDQTPPATIDAAVALAYADLGVTAADAAVLDAAMDRLGYRRRGTKVLRAFKESVQRTKKKMRGAGVRVP